MQVTRSGVALNVVTDGPVDAPALILASTLGTTVKIWDGVIQHMPRNLRIIRYDLRGHAASDAPEAPYSMGQLIGDAEAICDELHIRDCIFAGLGAGGMIAQGLAVKRPDILRAIVLSNTAAKIGQASHWQSHISDVQKTGLHSVSEGILQKWFGKDFRAGLEMDQWRSMLSQVPDQGYAGVCAAIAGTDFYTPTSSLRLPTLGIAGSEDGITPADLVRETVDLIPGSQFALIRRVGHLPCVEDPQKFAELLTRFLDDTGHCLPLAK